MASFEGGCPAGSRLGVLCRPPSGWQPVLEDTGGGYLFIVDSHAQASVRSMKLGDGNRGVVGWPFQNCQKMSHTPKGLFRGGYRAAFRGGRLYTPLAALAQGRRYGERSVQQAEGGGRSRFCGAMGDLKSAQELGGAGKNYAEPFLVMLSAAEATSNILVVKYLRTTVYCCVRSMIGVLSYMKTCRQWCVDHAKEGPTRNKQKKGKSHIRRGKKEKLLRSILKKLYSPIGCE